jgi:integrase
MAKNNLKVKEVENATIEQGEKLLADGDCLFLRVRPDSKTWLFIYRHEGGRQKMSLGHYPTVGLASARDKADILRKQLADGIDPFEERARLETEARDAKAVAKAQPQNVGALFDEFMRKALAKRKDGGEFARSLFDKNVRPNIGDLRLVALRRSNITAILDDIAERGAPRVAGIVLADLRQMFRWAIDREIVATDPTAGLKKSKWDTSTERDRALTETEIKLLAKAMPDTLSADSQRMVWLMLSTCCRVGEISTAAWSDVDLAGRSWVIPAEHSKNKKPHTVSLSAFALNQLQAMREAEEAAAKKEEREISPWVFPARHRNSHVCPKSLSKQVADRQRERDAMSRRSADIDALALPGGKWTPHDLRRTGATLMVSLGVLPDVVERCLNHTEENSMKRTYQRYDYQAEKREAWRLLGDRLDLLTRADADNVTTLPRAAA